MRRLIGLLALFGFVLPISVRAQSGLSDGDKGRVGMRVLANCIVASYGGAVDKALALPPMSSKGQKAVGKVVQSPCNFNTPNAWSPGAGLAMLPELMRGALFRAKFVRTFGKLALPIFGLADPSSRWRLPKDDPYSAYQAVGECVVRADPSGTRAIVEADIGSDAENRAFAAIKPYLAKCIPVAGTYRFSRTVLEGIFAEALFNLSADASVRPAAAGMN